MSISEWSSDVCASDLLHVLRTLAMARGQTLTDITRAFAAAWNIDATILPMTDQSVATCLSTDEGELEFQRYFVERQCAPRVDRIEFRGAVDADPAPGVIDAILGAETVLIAPSNPYLSIDSILSVAPIRRALEEIDAPVIAVSPIVGGKAVKGPTAKLMAELGVPVDNDAIAAASPGVNAGLLLEDRKRVVGE